LAYGKLNQERGQEESKFIPAAGIQYLIIPKYDSDLEAVFVNHKRRFRLD
jgi:hypothetical protein